MLTLALTGMVASLVVIVFALFGAVGVVLRREADLVVKVKRLEKELDGVTVERNQLARKLTRRRQPSLPGTPPRSTSVPHQRKAS